MTDRLQGQDLDGHALQLKLSNKQLSKPAPKATRKAAAAADAQQNEGGTGTLASEQAAPIALTGAESGKLMIRNIAFEANTRDIRELFGAFGKLKSVRIPKKADGTSRGFGFVEYLSRREAEAAMSALSSSHLYGRHLVIQWAEDKGMDAAVKKGAEISAGVAASMVAKRSGKLVEGTPKRMRFDV